MPSAQHISDAGTWKSALPTALRARAVRARLARNTAPHAPDGVPVLLTHPNEAWWEPGASPQPAPLVLWFHGRTVSKELDPGRYLRWARLGIAGCAVDLPHHGERATDDEHQRASHTLRIAEQAALEIDHIITALSRPDWNNAFDLSRIAIGGMSAGGMVTLIRLTAEHGTRYDANGERHTLRAAVIEASAGDFRVMEGHDFFVKERVERLNPIDHLDRLADAIPLLAVHSRKDAWVPFEGMSRFIDALQDRYRQLATDDNLTTLHAWDETGAPHEHMGFGTKTNDTKNLENAFLAEHLGVAQNP